MTCTDLDDGKLLLQIMVRLQFEPTEEIISVVFTLLFGEYVIYTQSHEMIVWLTETAFSFPKRLSFFDLSHSVILKFEILM